MDELPIEQFEWLGSSETNELAPSSPGKIVMIWESTGVEGDPVCNPGWKYLVFYEDADGACHTREISRDEFERLSDAEKAKLDGHYRDIVSHYLLSQLE